MKEQLFIGIIGAAAGIFGATIGVLGTILAMNKSLEATRRKDNFTLHREAYEARMQALSGLAHTSKTYWNKLILLRQTASVVDHLSKSVDSATSVSDTISSRPWVFSKIYEQRSVISMYAGLVHTVF